MACQIVTSTPYYPPTSRHAVSGCDVDDELNSIASAASAAVFASLKSSSATVCQLQNNASRDTLAGNANVTLSSAVQQANCAGIGLHSAPDASSAPVQFERRERVLLRPWLENLIDSGRVPGLEWIDNVRSAFKVPWKHRSKKNWSMLHSCVFLEWAKNTGRWRDGDPEPNYAQLKTRLRCAFNKAPDIEEMKELHSMKCDEPYKVYRFIPRRDGRTRPFARTFVTRASIPIASRKRRRRAHLQPSIMGSLAGTAGMKAFRSEIVNSCRQPKIVQSFDRPNQLYHQGGCHEDAYEWNHQMWKHTDPKLYQTDYIHRVATSQHNTINDLMTVSIKSELCDDDDDQFYKPGFEDFPPEQLPAHRRILPDVDNSCHMFPPPCQLPPSVGPTSEVLPPVIYKQAKIPSSSLVKKAGSMVVDDINAQKYSAVKFYEDCNQFCHDDVDSSVCEKDYCRPATVESVVDGKYIVSFEKYRAAKLQPINSLSSNNSMSLSSPSSDCSTNSSKDELANSSPVKQQATKVDDDVSAPRLHRFKNRYLMEQRQLQEQTLNSEHETNDIDQRQFSDCSSLKPVDDAMLLSPTGGYIAPKSGAVTRTLPVIDIVDSIALLNVGIPPESSVVTNGGTVYKDRVRLIRTVPTEGLQRYEQSWQHERNSYRVMDDKLDLNEKKLLASADCEPVRYVEKRDGKSHMILDQQLADTRSARGMHVYYVRDELPTSCSNEPEFYTDEELQRCQIDSGMEIIYRNGEPVSYSPLPADEKAVDLSHEPDAIDLSKKTAFVATEVDSKDCRDVYSQIQLSQYGAGRGYISSALHRSRSPPAKASMYLEKEQQLEEIEKHLESRRRALELQRKQSCVLPEFVHASDEYHLSPVSAAEIDFREERYVRYREQAGFSNGSSRQPDNQINAKMDDRVNVNFFAPKRTRLDDAYPAAVHNKQEKLAVPHGPFQIQRQVVNAVDEDASLAELDQRLYLHEGQSCALPYAQNQSCHYLVSECERLLGSRKRTRHRDAADVINEPKHFVTNPDTLDEKYERHPKLNRYMSCPQSYLTAPELSKMSRRAVGDRNSPPSPVMATAGIPPISSILVTSEQANAMAKCNGKWSTGVNSMLASVPTNVRHLVASAAGTTAASILPPLSPSTEGEPSARPYHSAKWNQPTVYVARNNSSSGVYLPGHAAREMLRTDPPYPDAVKQRSQAMRSLSDRQSYSVSTAVVRQDDQEDAMLSNKTNHYYGQYEPSRPSLRRASIPCFSQEQPLQLTGTSERQMSAYKLHGRPDESFHT